MNDLIPPDFQVLFLFRSLSRYLSESGVYGLNFLGDLRLVHLWVSGSLCLEQKLDLQREQLKGMLRREVPQNAHLFGSVFLRRFALFGEEWFFFLGISEFC